MGTVTYSCGCQFTHSMFGERELVGMHLCNHHLAHPKVLQSSVADVQSTILALNEKGVWLESPGVGVLYVAREERR